MEIDIWEETNFYGVVDDLEDKYSDDDKKKIRSDFSLKYGDILLATFFSDDNFFRNFINQIPEGEQEKYIENTINFLCNKGYDANYVIVGRRAVPSYESKPENFWTTEAREALRGLKDEIQKEQRLHSVIMISTLGKLQEHGLAYTEGRGGSDGEIVIDPNKSFSNFLFMYKPREEFWELVDYLEEGGMTREQLLTQLRATSEERAKRQGLKLEPQKQTTISIDEIEEITSGETISAINKEVQYLKDRETQKKVNHEEGFWTQEDDW